MPSPLPPLPRFTLPPFSIDGKWFKSVNGLCSYLCRKHAGAAQVSSIRNGRLAVYGEDRLTRVAVYHVAHEHDAVVLREMPPESPPAVQH
jgi:hypothetical protein